jgi:hypothetical protein
MLYTYLVMTGPLMRLVGPEILMVVELAHGWLAYLASLLLLDSKSLESNGEYTICAI